MSPFARALLLAGAVLAAGAVSAPAALAQPRSATAFDLVQLDPSARAAALGGAAGAPTPRDPTAAFYNPALLADEADRTLAVFALDHLGGVRSGSAIYVRTLPRLGVVASAAVRVLAQGTFERTDAGGATDGTTFGAGETALTLTAARAVAPRVRAGASVHALLARLDDARASALTADAGVTYTVEAEQLTLGASVHHVGSVLSSLGPTDDALPLDLRLTAAKGLRYVPLTVTLAAYDLTHWDGPAVDSSLVRRTLDHVALGGELRLGSALTARAGYSPRRGAGLRTDRRLDLAGASAGFGLALRRFALDYAFSTWGEFGGVHQFGVRTRL